MSQLKVASTTRTYFRSFHKLRGQKGKKFIARGNSYHAYPPFPNRNEQGAFPLDRTCMDDGVSMDFQ